MEIRFAARLPSPRKVQGELTFQPSGGRGEPRRVAVSSNAPLSVQLPVGSEWEVSATLPGYWVRRSILKVEAAEGRAPSLTLDLWPLGSLSGSVAVQAQRPPLPLPQTLAVTTLTPPSAVRTNAAPPGVLDCRVEEKTASWTCALPAATYDLSISAEGLAPIFRKAVKVLPEETTRLGKLIFEPGGSIAGWVVVDDGPLEAGLCIARLTPLVARSTSVTSSTDPASLLRALEVGSDGFLHFSGLAPGSYQLQVEQPGYPPVRVSPIQVARAAATILSEPVLLRRPLVLSFEIAPSLDWLGRPWRARVRRVDTPPVRPLPVVFDGPAGDDGRFALRDQPAGRFAIDLFDSVGNLFVSKEEEVDAAPDPPRRLEVTWVSIDGEIRLGREPLRASLWFGGRSGSTSIRMDSDERGRFQGVLPRSGSWSIEIEGQEPSIQTWNRTEVPASKSGEAKIRIDLPNNRVFGRVVDETGKPVLHAGVILEGANLDQVVDTGESNTFELRSLPSGAAWLGAQSSAQRLVSGRTLVNVEAESEIGPLELRLSALEQLRGKVVSPLGPVAGARILFLSMSPFGGGGQATTEPDGSFVADLPPKSDRVVAVVSAPGFALRAFEASTNAPNLSLAVSAEAGSLQLALPAPKSEGSRGEYALALQQNGALLPSSELERWSLDHGGSARREDGQLVVPEVAPGDYRACLVPWEIAGSLAATGIPEGASCRSGTLSPGGSLDLNLSSARP